MKKILIVEDEGLIALMLNKYLVSQNFNVLGIAKSGIEAIEKIKHMKPDLVIMDIILQGEMNGIEVVTIIKDFSNAPVIFVTGNSLEDIPNQKLDAEIKVFNKPITLIDLKKHIDSLLN